MRARWRLGAAHGVSPRLAARLVGALGSPRAVLVADVARLGRVRGIGPARAAMIRAAPDEREAARECERLAAGGGDHLIPGDEGWPAALDELPDPPLLLSLRGDLRPADQ